MPKHTHITVQKTNEQKYNKIERVSSGKVTSKQKPNKHKKNSSIFAATHQYCHCLPKRRKIHSTEKKKKKKKKNSTFTLQINNKNLRFFLISEERRKKKSIKIVCNYFNDLN